MLQIKCIIDNNYRLIKYVNISFGYSSMNYFRVLKILRFIVQHTCILKGQETSDDGKLANYYN